MTTKIHVSAVIEAPIADVWARIRDFNAMPQWHPVFAKSDIEGGLRSDTVGCVRSFYAKDGGHLREKLLSLSDLDHSCVYTILDSPMPIQNYVAGFRLYPITETNQTFHEWWATFEVGPQDEAGIVDRVQNGTFRRAFQALNEHFRARKR